MRRVVVVGGGVAALETCLALRDLAGDRVSTTLIAPNRYFIHRPVGIRDPLAIGGRVRVPLASVARAAGADLRYDRVETVDPRGRRLYTAAGYEVAYDTLVLATGAVSLAVPAGAASFSAERSAGCRVLLDDVRRGKIASLAFVEPSGPTRPLDLYDLALETAVNLRRAGVDADLTLVTAAPGPLAILGPAAAGALYETLRAHGLRVVDSAYVRSIHDGMLELAPRARRIAAAGVIALPRLGGPRPVRPALRCRRLRAASTRTAAFRVLPVFSRRATARRSESRTRRSPPSKVSPSPRRSPRRPARRYGPFRSSRSSAACCPPACAGMSSRRSGEGWATPRASSAHPLWSPSVRFGARFLAPYLESEMTAARYPTVSTASAPTHATTTAIVTA